MQYADMHDETSPAAQVKRVRELAKLSVREMAKRIGMSPSGYGHYEDPKRFKGPYLPIDIAEAIAAAVKAQGADEAEVWALTGAPAKPIEIPTDNPAPNGTTLVPIYDVMASAGFGAVVDAEDHVANLAFSSQYLCEMTSAKGDQLAAIRIKGDSMAPTIQDDDTVVIDRTKTNLDYDGLFVIRSGDNLMIKRISRGSRRKTVMIVSDNALYPPVESERTELDVVGKVIWYGRKV